MCTESYLLLCFGQDGQKSCATPRCTNKCCLNNPCQHKGKCSVLCGSIRRFECDCKKTGYSGRFCQIPLHSCADHIHMENVTISGIYSIVLPNNTTFQVFCDMDFASKTVWVLVQSFYYKKNYLFRSAPFHKTKSVNEDSPNFSSYRLSLHRMLQLKTLSTLWKASCNYEKSPRTSVDSMRGEFQVTDLFERTSGRSQPCSRLSYSNIRGYECGNPCDVVLIRDDNRAIHVSVPKTQSRCSYYLGYSGSAQAFGLYTHRFSSFGCSKSGESSTQWWFGSLI